MTMISNYSSFIELFAALYVTMAVEFDFFRKIWNPHEKDALKRILQQEEDEEHSDSHLEVVNNSVDKLYEFIALITNRRGGFMVALCVMLLIYIGNEQPSSYTALNCCLVLSWIIMLLSNILLRKWKLIVFFVILLSVVFLVVDNNQWIKVFLKDLDIVVYANEHVQYLVILTVLLPIIYHLLVNWMYHGVYQGYLKKAMKKAITEYIEACHDLENNPQENEDIDISDVEDTLHREIRRICRPSLLTLTTSLILHYFEKGLIKTRNFIKYMRNKHFSSNKTGVRAYINKTK